MSSAASLGRAVLDLTTDDKGLKTGLNKAESDSKTSINRIGSFLKVAIPAAAIIGAVAGVGKVLSEAVDLAAKEQVGIERLGAAVKATGADWDTASEAIETYLAAELKRTALDDGDGREAISRLTTATGDYRRALELMPLAQDLARAKSMDLASAAEIVGKVHEGNTGILSRYGITLEKGATAQEALAAMQSRFAGQAEAYGNTYEGAMARLDIAMGNIKETVGGALLPVLTNFTMMLSNLAMWALPQVEAVMDTVGEAVSGFWRNFQGLAKTVDAFMSQLKIAFEAGNWDSIRSLFSSLWDTTIWPAISGWGTSFWNWLTDPTSGAIATAGNALASVGEFITANAPLLWEGIKGAAGGFWTWLTAPDGAIATAGAALTSVGTTIAENAPKMWEGIKGVAAGFWDWLTKPGGAVGFVAQKLTEVGTIIAANWSQIGAQLIDWGEKFWEWLTGKGGATEKAPEQMEKFGKAMRNGAESPDAQQAFKDTGIFIGGLIGDNARAQMEAGLSAFNFLRALFATPAPGGPASAQLIMPQEILANLGSQLAEGVIVGFVTHTFTQEQIQAASQNIHSWVMAAINAVSIKLGDLVSFADKIATAIEDSVTGIFGGGTSLVSGTPVAGGGSFLANAAQNIKQAIIRVFNGIGISPEDLLGIGMAVLTGLKNAFIGGISGDSGIKAFADIGLEIINGILKGLEANVEPLKQGIVIFFDENVVKNIKNLLGIHSASTVSFEWAINLIQGFINGMFNMAGDLEAGGREVLDRAMQEWIKTIRESIPNYSGELHKVVKALSRQVLSGIGALAGETLADVANRAVDQMVATLNQKNPVIASAINANRELLLGMLGPMATQTVGSGQSPLNQLFSFANVLGGVGGTAAGLMESRVLAPMRERLAMLEDEYELARQQTGNLEQQEMLARAIANYKAQIREAEQDMVNLQRAQQDMGFLQQQFQLLEMMRQYNLNPGQILQGIQLGAGANPQSLVAAMGRALEAAVAAASRQIQTLVQNTSTISNANNWTIVPHYSEYQSEGSLRDDIQMLSMLTS